MDFVFYSFILSFIFLSFYYSLRIFISHCRILSHWYYWSVCAYSSLSLCIHSVSFNSLSLSSNHHTTSHCPTRIVIRRPYPYSTHCYPLYCLTLAHPRTSFPRCYVIPSCIVFLLLILY